VECLRNTQNVEELEEDPAKASLRHHTDAPEFVSEELKHLQPKINMENLSSILGNGER
jgi:hypothetical protein